MSPKEHALENAIHAFAKFKDDEFPLRRWRETDKNLAYLTDAERDTIETAALYVRYSLCDSEGQYLRLIGRN